MIICIGESLIDFLPAPAVDGSRLYRPVPGGCPYNCSIAAARLGGLVTFVGTVSTDFFGDQIVARLEENRVDTSTVTRVDRPTTLAFVEKLADGSARYAFYTRDAADRALVAAHLPDPLPRRALLQMGSISLIGDPEGSTILTLAERERDRRVIAYDPNVRPSLAEDPDEYRRRIARAIRSATIVRASDEDLEWIYPGVDHQEVIDRLHADGVKLVVITRGSRGSIAATRPATVEAPAVETVVSDTIGAGDSFMAAMLVWLDEHGVHSAAAVEALDADRLAGMLGFAGRVAAITCSRPGADPPWRRELT